VQARALLHFFTEILSFLDEIRPDRQSLLRDRRLTISENCLGQFWWLECCDIVVSDIPLRYRCV